MFENEKKKHPVWGGTDRLKSALRKGVGDPDEEQADHEPATHPYSKGDQQHVGLH